MSICAEWLLRRVRPLGCLIAGGLMLLQSGCSRDLSIPDPPPPTSARVRVTVTVVRAEAAHVRVSARQISDEKGAPQSATIAEDSKDVQRAFLNQYRTAEFNFPVDLTLIGSGTWVFAIRTEAEPPNPETDWKTECTTILRKDGLNNLVATEQVAVCTGDFALFGGEHEVGIGEVKVERVVTPGSVVTPGPLRVGDRANIRFIAVNNGENTESFDVTVQPITPAPFSRPLAGWTVNVASLPSGSERVVPTANDPPIVWDTTGLQPGAYTVRAELTLPVSGDPQKTNDFNSTIVDLAAGDFDNDGSPDDEDNCPSVANADQANCEANQPGGSKLGDACNIPKIRDFAPNCNIRGGATVTVIGFGFASIQPADIKIGNASATAVTSRSACKLEFTNPPNNEDPVGKLVIATRPQAVEKNLCCPTPTISTFTPAQAAAGNAVAILGCGFTGAQVFLVAPNSLAPRRQVPVANTSNAQKLDVTIPLGTPRGEYIFEIESSGEIFQSMSRFRVI